MIGDGSTNRFLESRPALANVTNQLGKRGFLLVSGNSNLESGNGYQKIVEDKAGDSQVVLQACSGAENLVKGKGKLECIEDCNGKGLFSLNAKRLCGSLSSATGGESVQGNVVSSISTIPNEIKEPLSSLGGDSCISSVSVPAVSGKCDKARCSPSLIVEEQFKDLTGGVTADLTSNETGSYLVNGESTHVFRSYGKELSGGDLASNKSSSIGCSEPSKPSGSKFELGRCTGLNGDGRANTSVGVDLLKACSCSFCLKAAYIWSDLHYQDIKGRVAALNRSQKEVSSLVERTCKHGNTDTYSQGNCNKSSKLEFDLMDKWRSLFLHVEDILVRETNQLQSNLLTLKELRGNCKMDLGDD
ncbi:hypothetical protein HHK36_004042 [Tetracentron sinense]|uniref:DNA-directed RNA polymerase n=1 Tax=Tetracentron sinense TaxID=13715 RepID=A0A834ZU32_TETSI|nr:hypothetical protein HHK36_004042 [Tetracentron sinense]